MAARDADIEQYRHRQMGGGESAGCERGRAAAGHGGHPLPPAPSAWSLLADFDNIYGTSGQVIQPGLTLFYEFDYILNIPSVFRPAAVRNWRCVDNTSGTPVTKTCPSVNFLQQRQSYGYQPEPGFPRNTASTLHEGASFV